MVVGVGALIVVMFFALVLRCIDAVRGEVRHPARAVPVLVLSYVLLVVGFAFCYVAAGKMGSGVYELDCRTQLPIHGVSAHVWFSAIVGSTLGFGEMLPGKGLAYWLVATQLLMHWALLAVVGATAIEGGRSPH